MRFWLVGWLVHDDYFKILVIVQLVDVRDDCLLFYKVNCMKCNYIILCRDIFMSFGKGFEGGTKQTLPKYLLFVFLLHKV